MFKRQFSERFWYVFSRVQYWLCALAISLLTISVGPTVGFTNWSPENGLYLAMYNNLLIVVMTFTSLAVLDTFEIFRLLPERPTLRYSTAVFLAISVLLILFVLITHFGWFSQKGGIIRDLQPKPKEGLPEFPAAKAANEKEILDSMWMGLAMLLCLICKISVSWMEFRESKKTGDADGTASDVRRVSTVEPTPSNPPLTEPSGDPRPDPTKEPIQQERN